MSRVSESTFAGDGTEARFDTSLDRGGWLAQWRAIHQAVAGPTSRFGTIKRLRGRGGFTVLLPYNTCTGLIFTSERSSGSQWPVLTRFEVRRRRIGRYMRPGNIH